MVLCRSEARYDINMADVLNCFQGKLPVENDVVNEDFENSEGD